MKLQKQLSRKVGDKKYDKWVAVLPPKVVCQVGWSPGQQLSVEAKNGGFFLTSKVVEFYG